MRETISHLFFKTSVGFLGPTIYLSPGFPLQTQAKAKGFCQANPFLSCGYNSPFFFASIFSHPPLRDQSGFIPNHPPPPHPYKSTRIFSPSFQDRPIRLDSSLQPKPPHNPIIVVCGHREPSSHIFFSIFSNRAVFSPPEASPLPGSNWVEFPTLIESFLRPSSHPS